MAARRNAELSAAFGDARQGCSDRLLTLLRPWMLSSVESSFPGWLRPRLDPEDVVQMAQVNLFIGLNQVRGNDPTTLKAWVRRVTRRALEERIRFHERSTRNAHAETPGTVDLVDPRTEPEETASLEEALRELPPRERRVFQLRHLEERTWGEIMRELDLSLSSCRELDMGAVERLSRRLVD